MLVLYLVAVQAIYNFTPRLRGIRSYVEFCDACKLGPAKYSERVGPANQLQQILTCTTSTYPKTVFHQPLRWSLRL